MARAAYSLDGKTVLVTGAARGIGAECARHIARRGARLALVGLEPEELKAVAADCGPEAACFEADVTDRDALQAAVDGAVERFGGIDVAIANAGIASGALVARSGLEPLERVVEVNLLGAMRTLRMCLPHVLERRGYLLPVASVAAVAHSPGLAAYSASKAGIEAFADALRIEVAHAGVDVGVAYFSWIDTDMVRGGRERRQFNYLRDSIRGPLSKTYPVSTAAADVVRGIERRARWVTTPRWLPAFILARGLIQPAIEGQIKDKMGELDRLSAEEERRVGVEEATAPVGAGGRAAMRAAEGRETEAAAG